MLTAGFPCALLDMFNTSGLRCVSMAMQPTLCGRVMHPVIQSITTRRTLSYSELPPDIEYQELQEKLKKGQVKLIDVRMVEEIAKFGYPSGSLSIPFYYLGDFLTMKPEQFVKVLGFPKPTEKDIIVTMCLAGARARTAQLTFMGAGYANVSCKEEEEDMSSRQLSALLV